MLWPAEHLGSSCAWQAGSNFILLLATQALNHCLAHGRYLVMPMGCLNWVSDRNHMEDSTWARSCWQYHSMTQGDWLLLPLTSWSLFCPDLWERLATVWTAGSLMSQAWTIALFWGSLGHLGAHIVLVVSSLAPDVAGLPLDCPWVPGSEGILLPDMPAACRLKADTRSDLLNHSVSKLISYHFLF